MSNRGVETGLFPRMFDGEMTSCSRIVTAIGIPESFVRRAFTADKSIDTTEKLRAWVRAYRSQPKPKPKAFSIKR